ncbi:MAG: DUF86 domain-containing protein [Microbacterium sp.]
MERYGERTALALMQFLKPANAASQLVAGGREVYLSSELAQYTASGIVIHLGQCVARMSDAFKADHPDVPWHPIRATRNVAAHTYEDLDHFLVWESLSVHLPFNAAAVARIVSAHELRTLTEAGVHLPPTPGRWEPPGPSSAGR